MSSDTEDQGGYRQINKSLNICAFQEYLDGQTASLEHLEDIDQLTPKVLRIMGQNPGKFTFQGTNTFVVGTGRERILIDTSGGEKAWSDLIHTTLHAMDIELKHVLLTHWHGDHTGGVPDLIHMWPHLKDEIYKNQLTPGKNQKDITEGQKFQVEGATIRAVHAPGHSADHMCFILEEEDAMFTGDNVLGTGSSAVEDLGIFMNSLQKMYDQNCPKGYPAHGATIENLPLKIKRELKSKFRRERQIMKSLQRVRDRGEKSTTVSDIVNDIYGESVDPETKTMALEPFMDEVLRKLAGDCKVAFEMRKGTKKWFSIER